MSWPVNGEKLFPLYPISVVIHSMNAIADDSLDLLSPWFNFFCALFAFCMETSVRGGCRKVD